MNVFVLCTGRSGSLSFWKACGAITNFTTGHESNWSKIGEERFNYPGNHIEIDNRLSWLLGRLEEHYGNDAFYVHLIRNKEDTAQSFDKRWNGSQSIIRAYAAAILTSDKRTRAICDDYWETINANIRLFLKDKSNQITIQLEEIEELFPTFWETIGAEGNLDQAMQILRTPHNPTRKIGLGKRIWWGIKQFLKGRI